MVDIRSEVNHELVMRLVSDVANGNRFYSDLNGFQVFLSLYILTQIGQTEPFTTVMSHVGHHTTNPSVHRLIF